MDISSLSPQQQQLLLQQLSSGDLGGATGQMGLELAGLLGEKTRAYQSATEPFVRGAQDLLYKHVPSKMGGISPAAMRMAGSGAFKGAMRALPALGAVGGVLGAADVIAGPDSGWNKGMDLVAMGFGGTLGAAGGPLGIAAGAGAGKMLSDATQWLLGDKMTAQEREQLRMKEALLALQTRGIA